MRPRLEGFIFNPLKNYLLFTRYLSLLEFRLVCPFPKYLGKEFYAVSSLTLNAHG